MRLRLVKELDLYSQQVVESGFDARKSYIRAHMFNQGCEKKDIAGGSARWYYISRE